MTETLITLRAEADCRALEIRLAQMISRIEALEDSVRQMAELERERLRGRAEDRAAAEPAAPKGPWWRRKRAKAGAHDSR